MTSKDFQDELSILINTAMQNDLDAVEIAGALIVSCCAFGLGLIQQEIRDDNDRD